MAKILAPHGKTGKYICHVANEGWDHLEFAAWVRSQLRRRDWNDSDFARRLGVSPSTVTRWLRGKRRPDTDSCDLIADVLGADIDTVLTLVGHRPKTSPIRTDDRRSELIALLKRVELTPDRIGGLEGILRNWIDLDRTAGNGAVAGRG